MESPESREKKLMTAAFVVSEQIALLTLRMFKLERKEGFRIDVEREEKLTAVIGRTLLLAYEEFVKRLGVTYPEHDRALEAAETLALEGLFYSIARRKLSNADDFKAFLKQAADIESEARKVLAARKNSKEMIRGSASLKRFSGLLLKTPEQLETDFRILLRQTLQGDPGGVRR